MESDPTTLRLGLPLAKSNLTNFRQQKNWRGLLQQNQLWRGLPKRKNKVTGFAPANNIVTGFAPGKTMWRGLPQPKKMRRGLPNEKRHVIGFAPTKKITPVSQNGQPPWKAINAWRCKPCFELWRGLGITNHKCYLISPPNHFQLLGAEGQKMFGFSLNPKLWRGLGDTNHNQWIQAIGERVTGFAWRFWCLTGFAQSEVWRGLPNHFKFDGVCYVLTFHFFKTFPVLSRSDPWLHIWSILSMYSCEISFFRKGRM